MCVRVCERERGGWWVEEGKRREGEREREMVMGGR